jgi:hypothetical protein
MVQVPITQKFMLMEYWEQPEHLQILVGLQEPAVMIFVLAEKFKVALHIGRVT